MQDPRFPPPEDVGLEDRGGEEWQPPPPRHRNLALTIGALSGIICGIALSVYLGFSETPFRGPLGWIVGFPVGVLGGTTLVFFLLRRFIDRPKRKG